MINDFLGQMDTKPIDWRLEKLYRQCETPTLRWLPRKQSPEKPHVVVNISQDTPFKENQLCTSELSVLVYFLVDCALRAVHTPHAIYPVRAPPTPRLKTLTLPLGHVCSSKLEYGPSHTGRLGRPYRHDQYPDWAYS